METGTPCARGYEIPVTIQSADRRHKDPMRIARRYPQTKVIVLDLPRATLIAHAGKKHVRENGHAMDIRFGAYLKSWERHGYTIEIEA